MTKKIECKYIETEEKTVKVRVGNEAFEAMRNLSEAIFQRANAVAL